MREPPNPSGALAAGARQSTKATAERREPEMAETRIMLSRGDAGENVRRVERLLRRQGFSPGPSDGLFDEGTEEAVRAFQAARGLEVDGVVGPMTWRALTKGGEAGDHEESAHISRAGARFIARFEGFRGELYNDAAGHCTIGYGHLVHRGPTDGSEPAEFKRGITQQRALELLQEDARAAESAVNDNVTVSLSQHQFDALVSFVFNVGSGNFCSSTLLRELNSGLYQSVPSELSKWVNAGGRRLEGLVTRRRAEGILFASGRF
jgi:lysozyme